MPFGCQALLHNLHLLGGLCTFCLPRQKADFLCSPRLTCNWAAGMQQCSHETDVEEIEGGGMAQNPLLQGWQPQGESSSLYGSSGRGATGSILCPALPCELSAHAQWWEQANGTVQAYKPKSLTVLEIL